MIFLCIGLAFVLIYFYLFSRLMLNLSVENREKHNKAGQSKFSVVFILMSLLILLLIKNSQVQLGIFIFFMVYSLWASFKHRQEMLRLGVSHAVVNKIDLIGIFSYLGVISFFLSYWL